MILDPEHNSQSLKIPKDIYLRILSKAISQTLIDIRDMETALPIGDLDKIQSISHRWKGDYDNMRIIMLSSLAKQLNEEVKTTRDKEKMLDLLMQFKANFAQLENELSKLVKP